MESIDDLLAQVKAEYQEQPKQSLSQKKPVPPPKPANSLLSEKDSLIEQVKAEMEPQSPKPLLSANDLITPTPVNYSPQSSVTPSISPVEESLLSDIKNEFKEQQKAEELKRQQQIIEEEQRKEREQQEAKRREEQKRQRRREALKNEAEEWLKKLNPRSEEGRWFEEFSYGYASKLEAAIDYMEALRETQR